MTASAPKVAWFTPFHKKSSIGQFSRAVTQQLSTQARVDLWVAETGDLLDTSLRVIPYVRISRYENSLQEYDYVVYNLGNQLEEDAGYIFEAAHRYKGVVILHDFAALEAVVGAMGVIVHSDLLRDRVRAVTCAPVTTIHLACAVNRTSPTLSRNDLGVPEDRLLVVTIDLNRNGHVETALRAIAAGADLKNRIYYMVLGSFDTPYGQQVVELSRELGLQDVVHFAGPAGEDLLLAALTDADICDETLRGALGQAALASQRFSAEEYASQFLRFCQESAVYQPAFRLAELVAAELKAIGVTPDMPIVDTVARQAAALLDGEWDPPILRK